MSSVQYEDIAQFLAIYAYKYLRSESDGKVPIFDDKFESAGERVSTVLYKLKIVEPASEGVPFRRWRFICKLEEFSAIALKNKPVGESREYLVNAVVGLAAQHGTDGVWWREAPGPKGLASELVKMLIDLNLCEPVQFETETSKWPTFIAEIPPKWGSVEFSAVTTRLTWTNEARKYLYPPNPSQNALALAKKPSDSGLF